MNLKDFYYNLPETLIAQEPIEQRDKSKLLVLNKDNGNIEHFLFKDIINFLNKGDCLVLNDTRVIPARLLGVKNGSGGSIEFMLLNRKDINTWEVMVRPGKRAKIGAQFTFGNGKLQAEIIDIIDDGNRIVKFEYDGVFEEILDRLGNMPLPPYIKKNISR